VLFPLARLRHNLFVMFYVLFFFLKNSCASWFLVPFVNPSAAG